MRRFYVAAVLLSGLIAAPAMAQQPPIKIGVLQPMSGVFASLATEQVNGMRIAVEEAGGAIAGRKIELIIEDTEAKPDVGLAKARKLVLSDRVDVMAGIVSSAVALAVAPYATQQKIPLVISNAATDLLSGEKCSRYVFRAAYSSAQINKPMGAWMAKRGVKSVFILAADFVAPQEFIKSFKETYTNGGGKVVGEAWAPFAKTQDYGPYISQARAANADAIYAVFFGAEAILFTKQYDAFGIKEKIPFYGAMGITPQMLHKAQGPAALGIVSMGIYIPEIDTPENKKFVATYQEKHKALPAEFAVMGYDSLRFLIEAIKARNGDTANKEAIVDTLEKTKLVSPRGPMSFATGTRSVAQNVYVVKTVTRNGETGFEILDTIPNVPDPSDGCVLKK